ncbi:MAG: amidohydrolase [Verrucomicrobiaceae bacterium]|nr:amidohydrolase [Verrucomicrobiaceae bacterium]
MKPRNLTYLVAGGVLDRNPKTQLAVIESGASWLAALAERMDEVYENCSLIDDASMASTSTTVYSIAILAKVPTSFLAK